jgi:LysE type translocator
VVDTLYAAAGGAGAAPDEEVASPRRAFLTALAATASNPLTIASWAAVFTAASVAGAGSAGLLVAGVGLGSLTSVSALAAAVAVARCAIGPRLTRGIEAVAGAGLVAFGGVLARSDPARELTPAAARAARHGERAEDRPQQRGDADDDDERRARVHDEPVDADVVGVGDPEGDEQHGHGERGDRLGGDRPVLLDGAGAPAARRSAHQR